MQALARPKDFSCCPFAADVFAASDEEGIIEPARPSPASPPICNRSRRLMPSQRVRRVPRIRSIETIPYIGSIIQRRPGGVGFQPALPTNLHLRQIHST